jgi:hypothetical protein
MQRNVNMNDDVVYMTTSSSSSSWTLSDHGSGSWATGSCTALYRPPGAAEAVRCPPGFTGLATSGTLQKKHTGKMFAHLTTARHCQNRLQHALQRDVPLPCPPFPARLTGKFTLLLLLYMSRSR